MKKYFSEDYFDNLYCADLKFLIDYMKDFHLSEMELTEAVRETGKGYFFCKHFGEVGEVGESCGKFCEKYSPLNKKNGRCIHSGYCYDYTNKKYLLKNGKLKKL